MDVDEPIPDAIADLPATAKLVYLTLEESDRPLSSVELAERTLAHPRTVRYALTQLDEVGVIGTNGDPVSPGYRLTEREEVPAGQVNH